MFGFDFKYPSEYFVFFLVVLAVISIVFLIGSGICIKRRQNMGETAGKKVSTVFLVSVCLTMICIVYILAFSSGKTSILVVALIPLVLSLFKKKNNGTQIICSILVILLIASPMLLFTYLDKVEKEALYKEEIAQGEQYAIEVGNTVITDFITYNDVFKQTGYDDELYYNGSYNDYNELWSLSVQCKEENSEYDDYYTFKFFYNPDTKKIDLDYIRDYRGTFYHDEVADEMFAEFLNNIEK